MATYKYTNLTNSTIATGKPDLADNSLLIGLGIPLSVGSSTQFSWPDFVGNTFELFPTIGAIEAGYAEK